MPHNRDKACFGDRPALNGNHRGHREQQNLFFSVISVVKSHFFHKDFASEGTLLEDRPQEDDPASPQESEPEATQPFNPLFAIGGVVIAALSGLMMVSGLLVPALVFLGVIAAFIGIQALIFKVFPPPKT
ncbi:MAG: hypothetical protein FD180_4147 [Planctomycetota bacterium]|nr:MAG: hypothetical protein FD180_4147 [Planctomycetota bacterium]